jgi:FdhD protein
MATKVEQGATRRVPDDVLVEEPLEIRLDDELVATTMRTPGNDFELAVGFCHNEGLLDGAPVWGVRYCATGSALATHFNVVTVETGVDRTGTIAPRLTTTTAACGVCGTQSIDDLCSRLKALGAVPALDAEVASAVARATRERQPLFAKTGAVHAAAAFDLKTGTLVEVREDIGRHNAVDKVVGRLVLDGALPDGDRGLFVSGRASFEMVQKAWAAGFSWVIAVGGASSLAIDTARAGNVGLAGFVRGDTLTIYNPT